MIPPLSRTAWLSYMYERTYGHTVTKCMVANSYQIIIDIGGRYKVGNIRVLPGGSG